MYVYIYNIVLIYIYLCMIKEEGPAAVITFLGMELDSVKLQIRLPGEKLGEMRATLRSWRGIKSCRKRDLLSIIGVLSHASKAIGLGDVLVVCEECYNLG